MKKMLNISSIREMQIKTTVRYFLTPVRMDIVKKTPNNKCWQGCGEREPSCTVDGNVNWCDHYGKHIEIPHKIKSRTTI